MAYLLEVTSAVSPTVMFVAANRLRDSILLSGPVKMVMTEGGPYRSTQTLVYQMYVEGFKSGQLQSWIGHLGSGFRPLLFHDHRFVQG